MLRVDPAAAEIPYRDAAGLVLDSHIPRCETATLADAAGVSPRVVLRLMRHSTLEPTGRHTRPRAVDIEAASMLPTLKGRPRRLLEPRPGADGRRRGPQGLGKNPFRRTNSELRTPNSELRIGSSARVRTILRIVDPEYRRFPPIRSRTLSPRTPSRILHVPSAPAPRGGAGAMEGRRWVGWRRIVPGADAPGDVTSRRPSGASHTTSGRSGTRPRVWPRPGRTGRVPTDIRPIRPARPVRTPRIPSRKAHL
jgi:hypothetical protein